MKLVICVQLAYVSVCLTREMSVVREWTSLDMQLPPEYGDESRRSITTSYDHSWLMYKDRVFVILSGWEYTLAYLDLTDNSTSPLLRFYPSYENRQSPIKYMYEVRADRCERLWTVGGDRGTHIIVFDLRTDSILRNSSIPVLDLFGDIIVDDFDCDNEYVYFSAGFDIWTYSWAEGDSWRHNYTLSLDLITSLVLAPNGRDSIVYYNTGSEVFSISTTHLRNKTSDLTGLERRRGLNVELYTSALDANSDVLYYFNDHNRTVIHAVPCWTSERCSSNCQDVSIDPTHKLNYITVDKNGYLWAITSRSSFEDGENINFRLLSVPINSICVESNANDTTDTSTDVDTIHTTEINDITTAASSTTEQTSTLGSVPKHTTVNVADTTAGQGGHNMYDLNRTRTIICTIYYCTIVRL